MAPIFEGCPDIKLFGKTIRVNLAKSYNTRENNGYPGHDIELLGGQLSLPKT